MNDIISVHPHLQLNNYISHNSFIWKVGNGESIFFWEHRWYQDTPIKVLMPSLYKISRWQRYSIKIFKDLWLEYTEGKWTRNLKAWEEELENQISSIINNLVLSKRKDVVVWVPSNIKFSTRTCFHQMEQIDNSGEGNWKRIWKMKSPPKFISSCGNLKKVFYPHQNFSRID